MKGDSGAMGMHKHGTKGRAGKGPRLRLAERMAAEQDERKTRPRPKLTESSVIEAVRKRARKGLIY